MRRTSTVGILLLVGAMAMAACGDDDGATTPDATTTPDAPVGPGTDGGVTDGGDVDAPPGSVGANDDTVTVPASTANGLDVRPLAVLDNDVGTDLNVVGAEGNTTGFLTINADNTVSYADTTLAEGSDSFNYTVISGPVSRGFTVSVWEATVADLAAAVAAVGAGSPTTTETSQYVNFNKNGLTPPGDPAGDFVQSATASVYFPAGAYTIHLLADEGVQLQVAGMTPTVVTGVDGYTDGEVVQWEANGNSNIFVTYTFATAGFYDVSIVHFDTGGNRKLELLAGQGTLLVTDTMNPPGNGSLAAFTVEPTGVLDTASVAVTIGPQAPPTTVEDPLTVAQLTTESVSPLGNDSDPTGDEFHLIGVHGYTGYVTVDYAGEQVSYRDTSGATGSDTVTYTVIDGPVNRGFAVSADMLNTPAPITSLAEAEAVLTAAENFAGIIATTLNYSGDGTHFAGDTGDFPGAYTAQFAAQATGYVYIPAAGAYTFGVRSDAGFSFTITGGVVGTVTGGTALVGNPTDAFGYDGERAVADTFADFTFATAGFYAIRIVYFDNAGDEELEVFSAPGALTAFDGDLFALVGQALAVFTAEPAGATSTGTIAVTIP